MTGDLQRLHHVGLVVDDMEQALALFRRLGFNCPTPACPMMSEQEGEPPRPLGAANTYASFTDNFIEIVAVMEDESRIPPDVKRVPLQAPAPVLSRIVATAKRLVATLKACLARFQGLHILVFTTRDVEQSRQRFDSIGVGHSGTNTVQRPVETPAGSKMVPVRYLEIDKEPVPEGRLAIAENPASEVLNAQRHADHPNGAVDLVESILCVADAELDDFDRRYQRYLDREPRRVGAARVFDLERSARVTIVPASALGEFLPGELPAALPAFVAYTVAVRDLGVARAELESNGLPIVSTAQGDIFVPAAAAMGAAVVFRQQR